MRPISTSAQSTEELIENILFSIVPDNLIVAAMTPNILSVLSFSVVFGNVGSASYSSR